MRVSVARSAPTSSGTRWRRCRGCGHSGAAAHAAAWLTRASIGLSAALMLVAITYQVVMRYVFGDTPSWSEELAVLLFSWSVLGGLALGVHEGWHVG